MSDFRTRWLQPRWGHLLTAVKRGQRRFPWRIAWPPALPCRRLGVCWHGGWSLQRDGRWLTVSLEGSLGASLHGLLQEHSLSLARRGRLSLFMLEAISLDAALTTEMISLWAHRAWLFLMMSALNVLGGAAAPLQPGRWTCSERQSARSLSGAVSRRLEKDFQDAPLTESAWQKEMVSRQVGYSGEEVTTCHKLTWAQIELSLPPIGHGGAIDALDWVGPRTREFLLNPEKLLKPVHEVNLPRMPGRVHIVEEDKMKIALELVKRNICTWVPLHSVYEVGGVKILNGLFGVSKPSCLEDGRPVLRLIMNLTGSNSTQLQLEGGCDSLPSITTWQSLVLDQNESLSLFQSDMCAAFYLSKCRHLGGSIFVLTW